MHFVLSEKDLKNKIAPGNHCKMFTANFSKREHFWGGGGAPVLLT